MNFFNKFLIKFHLNNFPGVPSPSASGTPLTTEIPFAILLYAKTRQQYENDRDATTVRAKQQYILYVRERDSATAQACSGYIQK